MVEVTQEHISWATSIAQHLCHPADRDAAIRLVSDGLARFEQEVLARASTAPDAEPVAWPSEKEWYAQSEHEREAWIKQHYTHPPVADRPVTSNPVDDRGSGNTSDKAMAQAVEALRQALAWHEDQDKAISKQPRANEGDNGWRRHQHQEQAEMIRAVLAAMGERS